MKGLLCSLVLFIKAVHCTIVEIPNGKLEGSYNSKYYSFTNIPYAQHPTGPNRFKDPIKFTEKWQGIRNATTAPIACVQFAKNLDPSNGVEECLVLHIFTPDIKPKRPYAVRVFLYGGAFMIGEAGSTSEEYVLRQNIILVIPNYRIGAFGFLSSGDELVSGNFGLKDQQLALKWVHENIHAFGGDPALVHLTGVSAGGVSTHLHLLSPRSWKYFNAAISSSGSALNPWVMQTNPEQTFGKYIRNLGCVFTNPAKVRDCLQARTKEEHFAATSALLFFETNPLNVFGVVTEPKTVPNAFLTEHPMTLIQSGRISEAPWIVGHSPREGSVVAAQFLNYADNGRELIEILNSRWREFAPILLFYNNSCDGCSEVEAAKFKDSYSDYLRSTYMKGGNFSVETYPLLEKMITDILFVNGIKEAVFLHGLHGQAPVYAYVYSVPLEFGIGNVISMRRDVNFGADHGADQRFVLPPKQMAANSTYTMNDKFIGDNLINMGRELSTSGVPKYGSKLLPTNNAARIGYLTIYKSSYEIENYTEQEGYSKNVYNNSE